MKWPAAAWLVLLGLVAVSASGAPAMEVAGGCDEPRASDQGRTFFVDPQRGADENNGSKQRPWRTLSEVLDPANHLVATKAYSRTPEGVGPPAPNNSKGPIHPGDTIVLMSGDHGSVNFEQYVNDDFISVVAAKGQTPVIRSLVITASSRWLFRGLKFQGLRPETDKFGQLVGLVSHGFLGPSSNIIFIDNSFSTEDSTAAWNPEDWVNRPYVAGFQSGARCLTLVNNHFFNLRNAMGIGGDQSLVEGNLIEDIGNDAIDILASDLVIKNNRIRSGRHTPAEPLHPDAIQGWSVGDATNRNVVIDSNSIVNLNPAEDNTLQGISIFDGKWDGLIVTNNLVINNAWHGIALYGVKNALVINNTIIPARPDRFSTWLTIHDGKDKAPSRNVIVRNNVAAMFIIEGRNVTFDHNIGGKRIIYRVGGRAVDISKGSLGDHNFIAPGVFHSFSDFDLRTGKLDLRPSARSPLAKAGSPDDAPGVDIAGRPREPPIDIGAFER